MSDAAVVTSHLSRYLALLRISTTLARHRTIGELFEVGSEVGHLLFARRKTIFQPLEDSELFIEFDLFGCELLPVTFPLD